LSKPLLNDMLFCLVCLESWNNRDLGLKPKKKNVILKSIYPESCSSNTHAGTKSFVHEFISVGV